MRPSVRRALEADERLKVYARLDSYEGSQKALEGLKLMAGEAPESDWFRAAQRARWHLCQSDANNEAFASEEDQPSVAATLAVAEFQVSLSYEKRFLKAYISKILTEANTQITGWRCGRQLGLISFLASAAVYSGVPFDVFMVAQKGRGLRRERQRSSPHSGFQGRLLLSLQLTFTCLETWSSVGGPYWNPGS